jgi:hypothetical protein
MPRKKKQSDELVQASLGHRISKHEAICAERMKTLFNAIEEMRKDIKDLRAEMNKGKGGVKVLIFVAGLVGTILGYLKWND